MGGEGDHGTTPSVREERGPYRCVLKSFLLSRFAKDLLISLFAPLCFKEPLLVTYTVNIGKIFHFLSMIRTVSLSGNL